MGFMEHDSTDLPMLAGVLTQAMTDPKLTGLQKRVGEESLHITGIDQVRPWAAGTIARKAPVLLVTATGHEAEDLSAELAAMLGRDAVALMPAFETLPHERLSPAADVVGKRNKVVYELDKTRVVVASARAACQPVLPPVEPVVVAVDEEHDFGELTQRLVDLAYNLGVQPGAFIFQVIAGHTGDGGVVQLHLAHGFRDALRLFHVQWLRLRGVDLAEVTAAGAVGATDKEGGLAGFPALMDVGAASFLAHGVQ